MRSWEIPSHILSRLDKEQEKTLREITRSRAEKEYDFIHRVANVDIMVSAALIALAPVTIQGSVPDRLPLLLYFAAVCLFPAAALLLLAAAYQKWPVLWARACEAYGVALKCLFHIETPQRPSQAQIGRYPRWADKIEWAGYLLSATAFVAMISFSWFVIF